jgi:hypothetical protein
MSAIGPELTSRDVRDVVDIGRKADMTRTSPEEANIAGDNLP